MTKAGPIKWNAYVAPVLILLLIPSFIGLAMTTQGMAQEGEVSVCHKPGTKSEKDKAVKSAEGLANHLSHGDCIGTCSDPSEASICDEELSDCNAACESQERSCELTCDNTIGCCSDEYDDCLLNCELTEEECLDVICPDKYECCQDNAANQDPIVCGFDTCF